jgi:hypothetical protein
MFLNYFFNPTRYTAIQVANFSVLIAIFSAVIAIVWSALAVFNLMFLPLPVFFFLVAADATQVCFQTIRTPEYIALRHEMNDAEDAVLRKQLQDEVAETHRRSDALIEARRREAAEKQRRIEEREKFCRDFPHVAREQELEKQRQHERNLAQYNAGYNAGSDLLSTALIAGTAYSIGASQSKK